MTLPTRTPAIHNESKKLAENGEISKKLATVNPPKCAG
jgi:hypothetical protein